MGAALSAYARPALLALASAAAASLLALGLYATTPRARQGIGGIVASTLWWSLADRLGVKGSFPYRSDQLTAATLDACLRKGGTLTDPDTRLVGFERASFGEGGGFLGGMERLELQVEGPAAATTPRVMVAKFGPRDFQARILTRLTRALSTEAAIYQHGSVSAAGVRAPRCYFAGNEPLADRVLVLMEDLAPLATADQAAGLTEREACSAVREIAKLHAKYWGRCKKECPFVPTVDSMKHIDLKGFMKPNLERAFTLARTIIRKHGLPAETLDDATVQGFRACPDQFKR